MLLLLQHLLCLYNRIEPSYLCKLSVLCSQRLCLCDSTARRLVIFSDFVLGLALFLGCCLLHCFPLFELSGQLAAHLHIDLGEQLVVATHRKSEGISREVTRAQDLEDSVHILLLVCNNRFV